MSPPINEMDKYHRIDDQIYRLSSNKDYAVYPNSMEQIKNKGKT